MLPCVANLTCGLSTSLAELWDDQAGRIANRRRGLQTGEKANLIEFTYDEATSRLHIQKTWLSGESVFSAN